MTRSHHVLEIKTTDMRLLLHDTWHERRVQVIRLRAAGRTYDAFAARTGMCHTGVRHLPAACEWRRQGIARCHRRRKIGESRRLTVVQETEVRRADWKSLLARGGSRSGHSSAILSNFADVEPRFFQPTPDLPGDFQHNIFSMKRKG